MPVWRREARYVVGIEEVGLVATGARYPLPAEVVAGQVAVEQVCHQPVGTSTPVHATNMHHIAGQPHSGVVVQGAGGIERTDSFIHYWHATACFANIDG